MLFALAFEFSLTVLFLRDQTRCLLTKLPLHLLPVKFLPLVVTSDGTFELLGQLTSFLVRELDLLLEQSLSPFEVNLLLR